MKKILPLILIVAILSIFVFAVDYQIVSENQRISNGTSPGCFDEECDGTIGSNFDPNNMLDGDYTYNPTTAWIAGTGNTANVEVIVMLNDTYDITNITLTDNGDDREPQFSVRYSTDNSTWTNLYSGINLKNNIKENWTINNVDNFTTFSARYISFYDMSGETNEPRVNEISIYGSIVPLNFNSIRTNPSNLALISQDIQVYCNVTQINSSNFTYYYNVYEEDVLNISGNSSQGNYSNLETLLYTLPSSYTVENDNWTFSCMANTTNDNTSWYNLSVYISPGYIDNCSGGFGISSNLTALNFTIYDENTLDKVGVNITGVLNYSLDLSNYYNYTFEYFDVSNFSICIYPSTATFNLDAFIKHKLSYNQRYYLVDVNLANSTQNVYMYNFQDSSGISTLTAFVKDPEYKPLKNLYVKLERYYPSEDLWRAVQIEKTDEFGKAIFYIIQNEEDYRFVFNREDTQIERSESVKFVCDSATECEQTFVVYEDDDTEKFVGMNGNITRNGDIYTLRWNDPDNTASSVWFQVEKQAINGVINICNLTATSTSGSLNCNISGYDGYITARAYRSASPYSNWIIDFVEIAGVKITDYLNTNDGVFFASMIQMTAIGFGAATGSGLAIIILSIFGAVVINLLQLTTIYSIAFLVGAVAVGGILIFFVKK